MYDLIKELEEYRLKNRISQEKLAKVLGVSFVSVNRWLNGHAKPQKMQIYQIEQFLRKENTPNEQ